MFARPHRLRATKDVQAVVRHGRRFTTPHLRVYWLLGKDESQPHRSTVVISKKTAKNASDRNRIKRRLRAAVRELHLPDGLDCVFFPQASLIDLPYAVIREELARWFKSAAQKS